MGGEWQWLLNVAGGIATTIVCAYVRLVQSQLAEERAKREELNKEVTEFKVKVAEKYVTHDDIRRIEDALIRIEAKIDVKADK